MDASLHVYLDIIDVENLFASHMIIFNMTKVGDILLEVLVIKLVKWL